MKASELVEKLKSLIDFYGDKEVYAGGEDYPGKVCAVELTKTANPYVELNAYKIYTN